MYVRLCAFWHSQTKAYHDQPCFACQRQDTVCKTCSSNIICMKYLSSTDTNTHHLEKPHTSLSRTRYFSFADLSKKSHSSFRRPVRPQSEKWTEQLRELSGRPQRSPFHPGSGDRLQQSPAWQSLQTSGPWRRHRDPQRSRSDVREKGESVRRDYVFSYSLWCRHNMHVELIITAPWVQRIYQLKESHALWSQRSKWLWIRCALKRRTRRCYTLSTKIFSQWCNDTE